MKVHICVLTGGRISPLFLDSWTKFIKWTDSPEGMAFAKFELHWYNGADIYIGRNHCIRHPSKGDPREQKVVTPWMGMFEDYDRVLWIDSDTVFEVADVKQILSHEEEVVSGCVKVDMASFNIQTINPTPYGSYFFATIKDRARHPETGEVIEVFDNWVKDNQKENGLCPIDACGSAFLAIRKGVYEKLGYPWYRTVQVEMNGVLVDMGEDIGFTYRIKEAGIQVWADPKVRPGHEKALELK